MAVEGPRDSGWVQRAMGLQCADSHVDIDGMEVHGAVSVGVGYFDCAGDLQGVVISDTLREDWGAGMLLAESDTTLSDSELVGNQTTGLSIRGGTSVVERLVVRETESVEATADTIPVLVHAGAQATLREILLEDNASDGGALYLEAATAEVEGLEVSGGQASTLGWGGGGLFAAEGAQGTFSDVHIHDVVFGGVQVSGEGTLVVLEDFTIEHIATCPALDDSGYGLVVGLDGQLEARRGVVQDGHTVAVTATSGGHLVLEEVEVLDTWPGSHQFGWGVDVNTGATLQARDLLVQGAFEAGLRVLEGAEATLQEVILSDNGTDLVQQRCDEGLDAPVLVDSPLASEDLCPDRDRIVLPVDFELYLEEVPVSP